MPNRRARNTSILSIILGILVLLLSGAEPGRVWGESGQVAFSAEDEPDGATVQRTIAEFTFHADLFLFGNLGDMGSLVIEESLRRLNGQVEKAFVVVGRTSPKQVMRGRDFSLELRMIRIFAGGQDDELDDAAFRYGGEIAGYYSSCLRKPEENEEEKVVFYEDHAVHTRGDGIETRFDGRYGSPVQPLEYFIANSFEIGDVIEFNIILDGDPYILSCEVMKETQLKGRQETVYQIDVTALDGIRKDRKGNPVVKKKKGAIRLWVAKSDVGGEGDPGESAGNTILQVKIKYRWYLSLSFVNSY